MSSSSISPDITSGVTWEVALGIIFGCIAGSILLHTVMVLILGYVVRATRNQLDNDLFSYLRWPTFFLFPCVAALIAIPILSPSLPSEPVNVIKQLLLVLLLAILTWVTINLARAITLGARRRIDRDLLPLPDPRIHAHSITQLVVISRAVYVILALLGLCAIVWSLPGGGAYGVSLLASAGVASLILGLASRPVLENLVGGLQIALTQPVSLEDEVVVDGVRGTVEEIGWQYVIVRAWDEKRVVYPLTRFISGAAVENWSRAKELIVNVDLGEVVGDDATLMEWRDRLWGILREHKDWNGKMWRLEVVAPGSEATEKHSRVKIRALASCSGGGAAVDRLKNDILEGMLIQRQKTG